MGGEGVVKSIHQRPTQDRQSDWSSLSTYIKDWKFTVICSENNNNKPMAIKQSKEYCSQSILVSFNNYTMDDTDGTGITTTYWAQDWSLYCSIISFVMTVMWSVDHCIVFFSCSFFLLVIIILRPVLHDFLLLSWCHITFLCASSTRLLSHFQNILFTLFLYCFCVLYYDATVKHYWYIQWLKLEGWEFF